MYQTKVQNFVFSGIQMLNWHLIEQLENNIQCVANNFGHGCYWIFCCYIWYYLDKVVEIVVLQFVVWFCLPKTVWSFVYLAVLLFLSNVELVSLWFEMCLFFSIKTVIAIGVFSFHIMRSLSRCMKFYGKNW